MITAEQLYGSIRKADACRTTECFSDYIDSCVKMVYLPPVLMEGVDRGLYDKHNWKKPSWTMGTKRPAHVQGL
ncbi:hypothetical protein TNCV_3172001 [Trichonephila clavipes]|nr:hypothetical protein TNCV_3172001 [Trichonephila clavipes]